MDPISKPLLFENPEAWREWLFANHDRFSELWVIYYKKNSGKVSIKYREALEEALCFGWIDGLAKSIDEECYMQQFTPRRKKSNWSEINKRLAIKLLEEGRMQPSGLLFREHWFIEQLNPLPADTGLSVPDVLQNALNQSPAAHLHFMNLPASCRKEYVQWIMSARREETRQRRTLEAVSMLEKGKRLGLK